MHATSTRSKVLPTPPLKVRVETKKEKAEFEKDLSTYQAARTMYETAERAEQAADLKIATAEANLKSTTEKKRIYILGKLEGINTILINKIQFVSTSSFDANVKRALLQELNAKLSKNTQYREATLAAISLDDLQKQLPIFAKEVNDLSTKIGTH